MGSAHRSLFSLRRFGVIGIARLAAPKTLLYVHFCLCALDGFVQKRKQL
jgi:hypothetical protein